MSRSALRLAVLTNSISRMNGGIFGAMRSLTLAVAADQRYQPTVFSARDRFTEADAGLWGDIPAHTFPVRGPRIFGYAPGLAEALAQSRPDIVHVHGIWMYPSVVARRWSGRQRPYVVSPHGLLKPWALRNSYWKKRIAAAMYEDAHLRRAACLHALNAAEAEAFRSYGLRNPICIVPNGTDLQADNPGREAAQGRSILYLGRLHPSKGLRDLLESWAAVSREPAAQGWSLTVAGWDQLGHRAELERLAERLQVRAHTAFLGPQFGAEKDRCLAAASAFILPSKSEGLPVSILEAWAWGLPVLMTRECNLPEGAAMGAALVMDSTPSGIAAALRRLLAMSDAQRRAMGAKGRSLVEQRYQWRQSGATMVAVYDWLLGKGSRPACVVEERQVRAIADLV